MIFTWFDGVSAGCSLLWLGRTSLLDVLYVVGSVYLMFSARSSLTAEAGACLLDAICLL